MTAYGQSHLPHPDVLSLSHAPCEPALIWGGGESIYLAGTGMTQ